MAKITFARDIAAQYCFGSRYWCVKTAIMLDFNGFGLKLRSNIDDLASAEKSGPFSV